MIGSFALPEVEIFFESAGRCEPAFLVIGGRRPDPRWLEAASRGSKVVGVDAGIESCMAAGVRPSFVLGDMDSVDRSALEWARSLGVEEKLFDRAKDRTDLQLALELVGDGAAIVVGAFGGRADHLFSAVESIASSDASAICMADGREGIFFLRRGIREAELVFYKRADVISLIPISDRCVGVRASGVRWPLDGASLERSLPWAISNELSSDRAKISCDEGELALYWCVDERSL